MIVVKNILYIYIFFLYIACTLLFTYICIIINRLLLNFQTVRCTFVDYVFNVEIRTRILSINSSTYDIDN